MTAASVLDTVEVGFAIPPLAFQPTVAQTVLTPAATLDSYPAHYDPDFARGLGLPGMFLNSMPLLGLVDRFATEWAGPEVFILRHGIAIKQSVFVGSPLSVEGVVSAIEPVPEEASDIAAGPVIEVAVSIISNGATCVAASVALAKFKESR